MLTCKTSFDKMDLAFFPVQFCEQFNRFALSFRVVLYLDDADDARVVHRGWCNDARDGLSSYVLKNLLVIARENVCST